MWAIQGVCFGLFIFNFLWAEPCYNLFKDFPSLGCFPFILKIEASTKINFLIWFHFIKYLAIICLSYKHDNEDPGCLIFFACELVKISALHKLFMLDVQYSNLLLNICFVLHVSIVHSCFIVSAYIMITSRLIQDYLISVHDL